MRTLKTLLLTTAALALVACDMGGGVGPGPGGDPGGAGPMGPGTTPVQPPQGPDQREVLSKFVGCMTLQNWTGNNMGVWAVKRTEGGTACAQCHLDGQGRFLAIANQNLTGANDQLMFAGNRYEIFASGFFRVEGSQVVANTAGLATTCSRLGHKGCVVFDEAFTNLENFVTATNQLAQQGNCPDQGFATP